MGSSVAEQNMVHRTKQPPTGKISKRVEMESIATKSENQRWRGTSLKPLHPPGKQPEIPPSRVIAMYGLLTKREVKMAGYWPSSFFACLWTETKITQTKNEANIQPS